MTEIAGLSLQSYIFQCVNVIKLPAEHFLYLCSAGVSGTTLARF